MSALVLKTHKQALCFSYTTTYFPCYPQIDKVSAELARWMAHGGSCEGQSQPEGNSKVISGSMLEGKGSLPLSAGKPLDYIFL